MAETRAEALRAKISRLESELGGGASRQPAEDFLRITVSQPLDGAKLGLAVKDLKVASITDPRAAQNGWAIGDRILALNDQLISTTHDFSRELQKAMSAYKAVGRPLVFEISRIVGGADDQSIAGVPPSSPSAAT